MLDSLPLAILKLYFRRSSHVSMVFFVAIVSFLDRFKRSVSLEEIS